MVEEVKGSELGEPDDIVFSCPSCGKSLAIDPRGAGLLVTCPDCHAQMQVPDDEEAEADELAETVAEEQPGLVSEPRDALQELRERNAELERSVAVQRIRMDEINAEMGLIQAALDRVMGIIQDAQIESSESALEEQDE